MISESNPHGIRVDGRKAAQLEALAEALADAVRDRGAEAVVAGIGADAAAAACAAISTLGGRLAQACELLDAIQAARV